MILPASHRTFGLDLSGYSGARSALAEIQNSKRVAFIYRNHPFGQSADGRDRLTETVSAERAALDRLLQLGTVLVDVPIDLQCLPVPPMPTFVWQLTARPVDFAYAGLRPLANRIGAPVARFQNLIAELGNSPASKLERLLETYPAASLICVNAPAKGYKRQSVEWNEGRWTGDTPLRDIARKLMLVGTDGLRLNDDEIDAIVCALAGVGPEDYILSGETLTSNMRKRLREKLRRRDAAEVDNLRPPRAYQLLGRLPVSELVVKISEWPPTD